MSAQLKTEFGVCVQLADVWDEDVGRCDPGGEKTNEWKQIDVVVGELSFIYSSLDRV